MKFKIEIIVEAGESFLKDLHKGLIQAGIVTDVLEADEKIIKFDYTQLEE